MNIISTTYGNRWVVTQYSDDSFNLVDLANQRSRDITRDDAAGIATAPKKHLDLVGRAAMAGIRGIVDGGKS